jgi:hypothetical protein
MNLNGTALAHDRGSVIGSTTAREGAGGTDGEREEEG